MDGEGGESPVLTFNEAQRDLMISEAEKAYPAECCGLLVGRLEGEDYAVIRAEPCKNLRTDADDRFEIDPKDYLAVDKRAREDDLEIIGVYHSHPDHAPRPSRWDAAAAHPGFAYLILAVRQGKARHMRSWLLNADGIFKEQEVVVK